MDVQPRVAVVTVNYNHASYLEAYVESLRRSTYPISEIIIVDNNSSDHSLDVLRQYTDIQIIKNNNNIGYSAALNQAFEHASCELVCATGPDITIEPGWLHPLVTQYRQYPDDTFAIASRVLMIDQNKIQSAGGSLHYTGHLNVFEMWANTQIQQREQCMVVEVGAIDSTSVLIDREKFLAIGGCDADFFVYHEEFDYCYRARMRGWRCWYHPGSTVYHGDGSAEYSVRGQGQYPRLRPYLHTRNRWLSILKNYQLRTLIGITPVLIFVEVLNLLMLVRLGLQRSYFDALLWLVVHWRDTVLKRTVIQPHRRLQDGDLLTADALTITPLLLTSESLRFLKHLLDLLLAFYWRVLKVILY